MDIDRSQEVKTAQESLDVQNKQYVAELQTSKGPIRLNFFADVAPGHVANFLSLAKIGFYDGLTFHRIIKGFMIQGGCPRGNGTGGPGYTIDAEFNDIPHEPGVLSMARTSDPNSAGSQFFICLAKHPHLDGQYTVFGKTADQESLETVMALGDLPTDGNDCPMQPARIEKVTVVEVAT